MRVLRVEHMSVLRNDRPAGPYGEQAFREAEHDGDWYCDNDHYIDQPCIHEFVSDIAWITGRQRPSPYNDGIDPYDHAQRHGVEKDNVLFAFASFEQYRNWFMGNLRSLHKYGFVLAIYDIPVDKIEHGRKQSMFLWNAATRIGETSILSRTSPI